MGLLRNGAPAALLFLGLAEAASAHDGHGGWQGHLHASDYAIIVGGVVVAYLVLRLVMARAQGGHRRRD